MTGGLPRADHLVTTAHMHTRRLSGTAVPSSEKAQFGPLAPVGEG